MGRLEGPLNEVDFDEDVSSAVFGKVVRSYGEESWAC